MIERVRHIPATALAILAAVAVQALFFAADDRPPRDPMDLALGLYPIAERLSEAPASALVWTLAGATASATRGRPRLVR